MSLFKPTSWPWFPAQRCIMCNRIYWGGFPQWAFYRGRINLVWLPSWMDFCSLQCLRNDEPFGGVTK